jgi:hypothetical protein
MALSRWAIVDSEAWALRVEVSSTPSKIARHALTLDAENDANDALDRPQPLRIEHEGYLNPAIRRSVDVEHEPPGGELDQSEPEVSGIRVGLVRLDVANATIIVLELALNEEIGFHWHRQIELGARVVRIERDLEIQVSELVGRHVCRFELQ